MKLTNACVFLFATGICGVAPIEALHAASEQSNGDDIPILRTMFNDWIHPEDLIPMPQCIAQQDQSTWLSTMTKCTRKRCTSRFGVICLHHQWLTQLSCLSTEFSSDAIKDYLPYCSRSVLAKAQLYHWIRSTTGRTWLVDVGDTNGLQNLSPASLAKGYAAIDVTYNAPTCLTGSLSAPSTEPFQHVMGSCSFTSTTQYTGNTARLWEYSESLRSMVALGFETVGYDLVGGSIKHGDYFDKDCFCNTFTTDPKQEACSRSGQTDLTRERLWFNATCGPTSLPDNWTDVLKTIGFAYIPIEDWHWPTCVTDMPKRVTELTDQCATDACQLDSSGYCKVKRAIDRTCFCRDISYDSCGGSCQIFETRIEYVEWLHDLCGNVQDWHGLPDTWRQLASPSPLEMIPWRWAMKPSNSSNITSIPRWESLNATEKCVSNELNLGSFALVNMATFLATFFCGGKGTHRIARNSPWHPHSWGWFLKGVLIATLQLLANCVNGFLVQKTLGYEDIPFAQLMLLWCLMPRLGWLTILPIGVQPFEGIDVSAAGSSLFAEVILQVLSLYYMILTVSYGREHNFYLRNLDNAERGRSAKVMYAGALLWLIIMLLVFVQLMRAIYRMARLARSRNADLPKWRRRKQTASNIVEELGDQLNEYWTRLGENLADYGVDGSRTLGETSSTGSEGGGYTTYGTLPTESKVSRVSQKAFAKIYIVTAIIMLFLWVAQWLFWGGFISLSSDEFCPPKLGFLTAVWVAFSLAGAIIRATV